ncbi:hypothetical protein [Actinobacillus vicugnae]|uniref:hypothetical protein n=1 Tax=Actinobacillus vicugnae TaxID=2573093 RepID=UPI001241BDFE|nr:hypothetical protein [Actinobacillus vicugnae]
MATILLCMLQAKSEVNTNTSSQTIIPQAMVYTQTTAQSLIQNTPTQAYLSNSMATPLSTDTDENTAHITIRSSYSSNHIDKINKEQSVSRLATHETEKSKRTVQSKNKHAIARQNLEKEIRSVNASSKSAKQEE